VSLHTVVSVLVGVCWALFALVWIGGAIYNARRAPRVRRRSRFGLVWLVGAVGAWLVARLVLGVNWLHVDSEVVRVIGAALLVAATAFTLWARIVLGTMWSSAAVAKEGHVLRTDGPYAITRHPIYTGILGMVLGTVLATGFGLVSLYVLALVVIFLELKIRAEERLLSEVFPDAYEEYRRRVPQLVPGLRLARSSAFRRRSRA
jgi:protein-S-isoprenylcysteine O-methyltransferase Ste14